MDDGPRGWTTAAHVGDMERGPGSGHQPYPSPAMGVQSKYKVHFHSLSTTTHALSFCKSFFQLDK